MTEVKTIRRQKKCVVTKLKEGDEVKIDGLWAVVVAVDDGMIFTTLKTKRGSKEFTHTFLPDKLLSIIRTEQA